MTGRVVASGGQVASRGRGVSTVEEGLVDTTELSVFARVLVCDRISSKTRACSS